MNASARHSSNLPAGFRWPAPAPRSECTTVLPSYAILAAISAKVDALRPAWEVRGSGAVRPAAAERRALLDVALAYRIPERRAYAVAWVKWCLQPEGDAPSMHAHRIAPEDARAIRQRFADAGLFDPRDFHNVPF